MRDHANERGFSLMTVLLALLLMAVAGSAALTLGTMESGTAEARSNYTQAMAAAESGLPQVMRAISPSMVVAGQNYVGSHASSTDADFVWLPGVDLDGDGTVDVQQRYRAWGVGVSEGSNGIIAVQGQVVRNGSVMSTAVLEVVSRSLQCTDPYGGQSGAGAGGVNFQRGLTNCAAMVGGGAAAGGPPVL